VTRVIRYRLVALTGVVLLALALFVGFFFLWVLAPVIAIGGFYLVLFANEELGAVGRERRRERRVRRERLSAEATARRRDREREVVR
jgi:predicted DNA repair protein MutK